MKSTLNLLDETGLLTVWEIIKLYLRELINTLGGTFENHIHTKNDISDLKNIDNPDKNDGGLMSLDLLTRLNSISLEGIRGISVNKESLTPNELSVIDITIPVNVSDLPNDAGYLTEDDVQGAITASLNTDLTVVSEGNGNAVTSISKSESSITVHKDTTFLTEHQDISGKANVTDVYTKTEADETFLPIGNYLTQHQDISGKANVGDSYTKQESDNKYQPVGNYLTLHQDISGKADKSAAIGSLNLSINPTNFLITLSGTKVDGTSFTVQDVIDLPLESVVVSGSYNNTTKRVVLTLLNGSTIDFSVADLVAGLQSIIDSNHKLSADLVDDTNTTHKFVTASEKTTWNSKYDKPNTGIPSTDMSQAVLTSLGLADTALLLETDPIFSASPASNITNQDITNWNNKLNSAPVTSVNGQTGAVNITIPTKVSDLTNDSGFTNNTGTITGITMNGASKGTSGVVDLGTVLTQHLDISGKVDKVSSTDNAVVRFDGTAGRILNSGVTIDDSNNITANSFKKSGGTASLFLKADGSVDSTTYYSKPSGGIPSSDLTTAIQSLLAAAGTALLPADITTLTNKVSALEDLVATDSDAVIDKFNEIVTFLNGINATDTLSGLLADIASQINAKYTKPSGGIPKSDLANDIQTSLGKADTALLLHLDISGKADKVLNATNGNFAGLDTNGNLIDSGKKASDFATAAQGALADTALQSISAGDNVEVNGNEVSVPTFPVNKVVPIYEKTYENYTCGTTASDLYVFFGNITAISNNWTEPWEIFYTLKVSTSNDACQGEYDVRVSFSGTSLIYAIYNKFYSSSYLPIYAHYIEYHNDATKFSNRAEHPVKIGARIQSSFLPAALARTYNIKIWELRNCTFSFPENLEIKTNVYNASYYAETSLNATSPGLQETGDLTDVATMRLVYSYLKAGVNGIKMYSLVMQDGDGNWLSFTTGTGGNLVTKQKNPIGFRLGSRVYYISRNSDLAAGSTLTSSTVHAYIGLFDWRYTLNINTTAYDLPGNLMPYLPIYIVGHMGSDGLFYLEDMWWTLHEPTYNDGKIYIRVSEAVYPDYVDARCYRADLVSDGYAYWFKDGVFRRFYGKESLNSYSISDLEFVYRKTADGITLYNGNKAAINNIKGNTLAWNQLISAGSAITKTFTSQEGYYYVIATNESVPISGHVYYMSANVVGHITNNRTISIQFGGAYTGNITCKYNYADNAGTVDDFNGNVKSITTCRPTGGSLGGNIYINNYDTESYGETTGKSMFESGDTVTVNNLIVFDLTLIYGSGNEPSTPEEFEADYLRWFGKPLIYEDYDAGSLRNVQMQGLKSIGFNQWDEEWEVLGSNMIVSKNFCKMLPNTSYYLRCNYDNQYYLQVLFYDHNKELITRSYYNRMTFVSPSNTEYFKIQANQSTYVYGNTYNNDICINISDPSKDGTYEPYEEHNVSVPVTTLTGKVNGQGESVVIFPDGMKGVGDIKDEIKVENGVTKAIKRIGRVDLGSLTWEYGNTYTWMISNILSILPKSTNITVALFITPLIKNHYSFSILTNNGLDGIAINSAGKIIIRDSSYTDATSFKIAMSGVYFDYELAEPIEYVVDDFSLPVSYTAYKEGTEEIINTELAPILDITYGINISDIKGLPKVSSSDNGKTLLVVNGLWALVSVPNIYTGTGVPSDLDGNDGDIYIQTI